MLVSSVTVKKNVNWNWIKPLTLFKILSLAVLHSSLGLAMCSHPLCWVCLIQGDIHTFSELREKHLHHQFMHSVIDRCSSKTKEWWVWQRTKWYVFPVLTDALDMDTSMGRVKDSTLVWAFEEALQCKCKVLNTPRKILARTRRRLQRLLKMYRCLGFFYFPKKNSVAFKSKRPLKTAGP